jgi:hypothetical protein
VCRYSTDRILLHARLKSRQVTTRASTHRHVPYGDGPRLSAEVDSAAATCPAALDAASLFGRAPALPHVPRHRTPPPCSGGLRRCHMSHGSGSCLPAHEGSDAATCPTAPELASLLGRAPTLPCVPRLGTLPPCSGGLRCCHVSHGSGPCLPAREGSGAATCPMTPDPASLLGRAPALPRVLRHRTPPPCSGGLRRCHVSHDTGPRLLTREGSGAAMCPTASDPASLLGRTPTLPRVPWHRILPPCSGGLRRCHVSHSTGPRLPTQEGSDATTCPAALWATYLKNKEWLRWPT